MRVFLPVAMCTSNIGALVLIHPPSSRRKSDSCEIAASDDFFAVLLGGTNRPFAHHLAGHLRGTLPDDYRVVDDLAEMPSRLRGVHPRNPVNRPRHGGVQVELPPSIRWNLDAHDWSDRDGTPRAPQLDDLIDALAAGAIGWVDVACGDVA